MSRPPDTLMSPPPLPTASSRSSSQARVEASGSGYFGLEIPQGSVARHGTSPTLPPYRPQPSTSWRPLVMDPAPGTVGAGASRSLPRKPSHTSLRGTESAMENWASLQEMVGEEDEQWTPRPDGQRRPRVAGSYRSLRGLFQLPNDGTQHTISTSRPLEISPGPQAGMSSYTQALSSSPSQLDGLGIASIETELQRGRDAPRTTTSAAEHEPLNAQPGDAQPEPEDVEFDKPDRSVSPQRRSRAPVASPGFVGRFWPPSPAVIAIFKCSLAYFIASLFTFVPALAGLLSMQSETDAHGRVSAKPAYSAHVVATIVVYFNPAKTLGNMVLALRFCFILALMAATVSLLAMGTIALFDEFSPSHGSKWDWVSEIGDWIVCGLWIGGSMGALAWLKLWVNNPGFNTGCSMAAMIVYTVVIKEGAIPKLLEIMLIVLIGAVITALVCVLVFPVSATTRLQKSISKSVTSFSTLLDLLTSTFLLEQIGVREKRVSLKDAVQAHAAAFKSLKNDLAESKHERIFDPRVRGRKLSLYDAAIGSLGRLAQHLAGMRSSTRLQESLIKASREGKINLDLVAHRKETIRLSMVGTPSLSAGPEVRYDIDIAGSVQLFQSFEKIAGTTMDELVDRCDDALDCVEAVTHKALEHQVDLAGVRSELAKSLKTFNRASSRAIKRLYAGPRRAKGVYEDGDSSSGSSAAEDEVVDLEDHTHGPNETVFFVYFFLFTLEEFARELLFLLDTMTEIISVEKVSTMDHIRSLIKRRPRTQTRPQYLYKQLQQLVPIDPSKTQPPLFPRNQRDARGTLLTPPSTSLSLLQRLKQGFWELGDRLRQPDMRYAIKTAVGGAILAAPAYTEYGRPIFLAYRGEWALIAYFATMSPTVGQTNFLSFFRVIGTLLGACVAVALYTLFPGNAVVLPILGWLFSLPCFYIITQMPDYAQAGRFILLTYNLSCLYVYNSRERDGEEPITVTSIAFHRSTSVIIGVLWAAIVSRYWWPFTARRELRMGISDFCLDLSYLYSKLVTTYSKGIDPDLSVPAAPPMDSGDEQEPLLPVGAPRYPHLNPGVRQFMAMELHLQSQLVDLRKLLNDTRNEPRLKGPFAYDFYREVLLSCERMLDRLHSMRCVTTRDEWDNGIRAAFVIPVNKQRREMAGSVILYYYVLSAGFRLRTPMPPYLPPAEHARQRLVEAIRSLDVVKRRSVRGGGRHLLFFAYALAMQEVIAELEYLGGMMQDAFGVISQSTVVDFEALFPAPAPGRGEPVNA